ncbi:unnamed protein product [Rotaria sp. Silwood2]|nr:unnamed protein product [Rotaria sp. Silwood2]CAF4075282.1 unnamed protein product [Rotaria sp. Silwood2]
MATSCNKSTLETFPDEILLEFCKYLLCTDILISFTGLNYRITQMITQYRRDVSLHKTSLSKSTYLCINILPQIGSQVRSLLIDCCYSVLQDELFIKCFGQKMSITFPKLERISLVSYEDNQLIALLDSLHDLNNLVEIRLYGLFDISETNQSTVVRSLFQANNHRLTTILLDDQSTFLSFHQNDSYVNIIRLKEQCPLPHIPKLSRLLKVRFYGSIPSDLNHFSFVLNAASNLVRLDLPFEFLWQLIEDQQIRHVLGQRITSLFILGNATNQSSVTFNEEHVPIIASTFFRVHLLYANLIHLPHSPITIPNDNIIEDSTVQSLLVHACQQKDEVVSPCSSESMVICLLREFKEHRLIGLGISGEFFEKLKTDTKQWLQHHTILCEQQFEAVFNNNIRQILIWM